MKRKILVILICTLVITTIASFSVTAVKCERKPQTQTTYLNSPPNPPTVKIPDKVKMGGLFYVKAIAIDPDKDNVFFKYELFGELSEWTGPYESGEEYLLMILIGLPAGDYTLGVQAKDIHGAESEWTYSDFTVVKAKSVTSPFLNFLQSHPNLLPILRNLLGV